MTAAPKMRDVAARGMIATGSAQAVRILLQFVSLILLSRLLTPADFGMVAMVTPVVAFVALFQDFGLQAAIIQKKDITQAELSRLFYINMLLAGGVALVLLAISPLVGMFYGNSTAALLTACWAAPVLISALAAQQLAILNRAARFGLVSLIDIAAAVSGLIAALAVAYIWRSYWAMWAQLMVSAICTASLSWMLSGWRPLSPREPADTGPLLRFGAHITGFSFLNYMSRSLDRVMIGRSYGADALGYYDRAYRFLLFPLQSINAPVGKVMVPLLSRMQDQPHRVRAGYIEVVALLNLISMPGIAAATATSSEMIVLLLGPRWEPSALIFAWLGIAGLMQNLANSTGWLFIAQGRTREMLRWSIYSSATTVASFLIGMPWGPTGVAAAYAISGWALRLPVLLWLVGRCTPVKLRDLIVLQLPLTLCAVVVFGFAAAMRTTGIGPLTLMIATASFSYALAVGMTLCHPGGRDSLRLALRGLRQVRGMSGAKPASA